MSDIEKKNPTYAERQQRKSELMADAKKAMETGDLDAVIKHKRAGRYSKSDWLSESGYFGIAAQNGHVHIIDFYINDANKNSRLYTMTKTAAKHDQKQVVNFLIEQGADNDHLSQGLVEAAWHGKDSMVEHLLSKGAIARYDNESPLLMAASSGHCDVVKRLVANGADIHTKDDRPLKIAVSRKDDELTKTIIVELDMPIKDQTKQWLVENNAEYALRALRFQELSKKLEQKAQGNHQQARVKTKSQRMKI